MIEVRWHGRGGQGSFTVARLLGKAASIYEGKSALAFPSFGPERRGAPVLGFTKIDEKKITYRSEVEVCNFVVVLDETLIDESTTKGLAEDGSIIINTAHPERYSCLKAAHIVTLDATSLALVILGRPITNTAMLGALIAASPVVSIEAAEQAIQNELKPAIAEKNVTLLRAAYKTVKEELYEQA